MKTVTMFVIIFLASGNAQQAEIEGTGKSKNKNEWWNLDQQEIKDIELYSLTGNFWPSMTGNLKLGSLINHKLGR